MTIARLNLWTVVALLGLSALGCVQPLVMVRQSLVGESYVAYSLQAAGSGATVAGEPDFSTGMKLSLKVCELEDSSFGNCKTTPVLGGITDTSMLRVSVAPSAAPQATGETLSAVGRSKDVGPSAATRGKARSRKHDSKRSGR